MPETSQHSTKVAGARETDSGELLPAIAEQPGPKKPHPIAAALQHFLRAIDDYRDAVNIALPTVALRRRGEIQDAVKKLDSFDGKKLDDGTTEFELGHPEIARDLLQTIREFERLRQSRLLPAMARSFFIGIFSEYDSFIGSLLKAIYLTKPDLFKAIKREISLNELLEFENLDAVKQDMLDKEIDTFRRQSYIEQFLELERKFEFSTLRAFPEWSLFVEMSQRRNIMTHNDGRVSEQYLSACDREGYRFEKKPALGQELMLEPSYMSQTLLTVSKVGFMLAHTLWRKLLPHSIAEADDAMNAEIYDLLLRKRWITAGEFGRFGLSAHMLRDVQDIAKRIRIVNTAIALKQSKNGPEAIKLLNDQDWSACIREFKLANAVLKENYLEAVEVMRNIGESGELVNQVAYHMWPLFEDFRARPEFHEAYESIYKVPFMVKASEEAQVKKEDLIKKELPTYSDNLPIKLLEPHSADPAGVAEPGSDVISPSQARKARPRDRKSSAKRRKLPE